MTDAAIAALENRLKTVTARLDQVEKQIASGGGGGGGGGAASHSSSSSQSSGGGGGGGATVTAYDDLVSQYIDNYVRLSDKIDPLVKKQAEFVKAAVSAQRQFLQVASQSKKPSSPNDIQGLLKPTIAAMEEVTALRNKNRASKVFNWLSVLSEGISALGWVAVEPAPGPFVDEARASSEFYSNKILMEFKTKEGGDLQREWVAAWNNFLKELRQYVKQYHTTGLTWNPQGGTASASAASSSSSSSSSGAGGPPPPPGGAGPPPPPEPSTTSSSSSSSSTDRGALLAQINAVKDRQTGGRTEGLRKVQAHEKSKNRPAEERSAVVPAAKTPARTTTTAAKAAPTRPPKFTLEANKWVVEFQKDNKSIIIDQTETRQTVYIFKCENSVIQVKGKVNAITVDSCKKTGIVFENAIATLEVVNCQSVEVQVQGRVPNLAIDKTDGCQIYLSKDCLDVEIITSKCSEMNVMIPNASGGDPTEKPIPEQFKTTIKGNSLSTEAVQHLG